MSKTRRFGTKQNGGFLWCILFLAILNFAHEVHASKDSHTSLTIKDFFFPRAVHQAEWSFTSSVGVQYPIQSFDAYSPLSMPMTIAAHLIVYDAVKRMEFRPFLSSLTLIENGRGHVLNSFGYGFNLGAMSVDVFVHPRFHFHYALHLYSSEFEHQVAGAGLLLRLGFRIPIWFRSSNPSTYNDGFFHIFILPVSTSLLARIDESDLTGFDAFKPVINGHATLEWGQRLLPWLRVGGRLQAHVNYTHWGSVILQGALHTRFKVAKWFSLRVESYALWPVKPSNRRAKVYNYYFLHDPSFGANLWLTFHLSRVKKSGTTP